MRMQAEDLIAAVFPDQIACAENLVGEREVPDHPLVRCGRYHTKFAERF
jgi:ATP-dependent Lhr-like helicase